MIQTIGLRPLDQPTLTVLSQTPEIYAAREGVELGPCGTLLRDVAVRSLAFAKRTAGAAGLWGGYLAVDPASRCVVGTCSFKGSPDADGMVEIAYYTFPPYEGRGYATAMATALRERAATSPAVRIVRAHTLPERNASVRILEKLGFLDRGEVLDPQDGPVWRWDWPVRRSAGTAA